MAQAIETKNVDRRSLRFESLDDLLCEAESLAAADRAGKVRCSGNWTLGQIFGHLATWMNYAFEGAPLKPPFIIKLILRIMGKKKQFVYGSMPAGVKIPGVDGGTLAREAMSTEDGLQKLRQAVARLKATAPTLPHPIFGPMTHAEWQGTHLRHAELHLGFVSVDG